MFRSSRFGFLVASTSFLALSGAFAGPAAALTLDQAMIEAYQSNPTILAQRAGLKATDETVPQALSGWRPTVEVDGSAGYQRTDSYPRTQVRTDAVHHNPMSVAASVSQQVYTGGRTTASVAQAESNVRAARANLSVVEQNVLLNVVRAYLDVVRDEATLRLNENQVEVLERQLQATRDRFDVGEITLTDVAQAEARLSRSRASRDNARGALQTSRATFEREVGLPADGLTPAAAPPAMPISLDESLSFALLDNPTLQASQFSEDAAEHAVDVAFADLLPQVALTGTLQRSLDTATRDDRTDTAAVLAAVSVPLYQAGLEASQVRGAKQTRNQARIQVEEARLDVIESATAAWETLVSATAQIVARQDQVSANEIALEGVRQEASVGARTTLDVLDAEQELLDSQVALVSAERDELVAAYQLKAAVGQLTAEDMGLAVEFYDPEAHYRSVRDRWFGWSVPETE